MPSKKTLKLNKLYDKIFWNPFLALLCLGFVTYKHYVVHDDSFSWDLSFTSLCIYVVLLLWAGLCFYNVKTKGAYVYWVNKQWGLVENDKEDEGNKG